MAMKTMTGEPNVASLATIAGSSKGNIMCLDVMSSVVPFVADRLSVATMITIMNTKARLLNRP